MNFFDPVKNKRIAVFSPIIAALIAGTYYIAMKIDFDADIGHFARGSVPFIICVVLSVLSGAAAVLSYYSAKKYDLDRSDSVSPTYVFGAVLASILSFAVLFFGLRDMKLTVLSATGTFTSLSVDNKLEFVSLLLSPTIAGRVHPHLSQADAEHMASHSLLHFRRALPERVPLRVLL